MHICMCVRVCVCVWHSPGVLVNKLDLILESKFEFKL